VLSRDYGAVAWQCVVQIRYNTYYGKRKKGKGTDERRVKSEEIKENESR
jgi:hypothetical protein